MGNGVAKLTHCFSGDPRRRHVTAAVTYEPYDDTLGHSFCYLSSKLHHSPDHPAAAAGSPFYSISGAAVSANASTALSTDLPFDLLTCPSSAAFESSDSFSSIPLQPVPRFPSGPFSAADRGFLSGPIERGFMSGPLDPRTGLFSGPLDGTKPILSSGRLRRSFSHGGRTASSLLRNLSKAIARTIPTKGSKEFGVKFVGPNSISPNLEWAQGKAGEDRVHVVVSEDHGWIFVGIYDGFNGPDATDYLVSNLYSAVQKELNGVLWVADEIAVESNGEVGIGSENKKRRFRTAGNWEWEKERLELDRRLKEQLSKSGLNSSVSHSEVLKALSLALQKTEEAYLDTADKMVAVNPELALMGSCVLAMLMKGEDVYLMNVGDSRAVLAKRKELDVWNLVGKAKQDLERINEETLHDLEGYEDGDLIDWSPKLAALQLTLDHSTCVEEEVRRIKIEHPEDASAVMNDRVKGSLKVTRAFGAGFLKQPKWNNALLEMFRIDYIGTSPYITCNPFLCHYKLGPKDRFLILSSDGLYQYLTNEEAVAQVELFIATTPEGDPAQHLVEEVLFRAAKKAGMDFHELLEIPQGDRRRYHDDVSVIVISFEGRIWRSCV